MAKTYEIYSVDAKIGGVTVPMVLNSATGYYEATLTAPNIVTYDKAGNYFPIELEVTSETGTYYVGGNDERDYYEDLLIRSEYLLSVVKDRKQSDVDRIKYLHNAVLNGTATTTEKNEYYNTDLKGALNRSDLLRVKSELDFMNWYTTIGGTLDVPTLPSESYYESLLTNIEQILEYVPCTVSLPEQPLNTFEKWNMLEKAIQDIVSYMELDENYPDYIDIEHEEEEGTE